MPVIVTGMHRSGTSAMTRCLNLMGLSVGPEEDLLPPSPDNSRGVWENEELTRLNEDIFALMDGAWMAPPDLDDEWWLDRRLDPLKTRGREVLRTVFDGPQWVWKDPRLCLTLPFWLPELQPPLAVVFIYRNPLEVWRSLESRVRFTKDASLALWAVYTRSALLNMSSLPVFAIGYSDLLEDPRAWLDRVRVFLERSGIEKLTLPPVEMLSEFLTEHLRHWRCQYHDFLGDADATEDQKQLFDIVRSLPRESDAFTSPALPCRTCLERHLLVGRRGRAQSARLAARVNPVSPAAPGRQLHEAENGFLPERGTDGPRTSIIGNLHDDAGVRSREQTIIEKQAGALLSFRDAVENLRRDRAEAQRIMDSQAAELQKLRSALARLAEDRSKAQEIIEEQACELSGSRMAIENLRQDRAEAQTIMDSQAAELACVRRAMEDLRCDRAKAQTIMDSQAAELACVRRAMENLRGDRAEAQTIMDSQAEELAKARQNTRFHARELEEIRATRGWQLLTVLRSVRDRVFGKVRRQSKNSPQRSDGGAIT